MRHTITLKPTRKIYGAAQCDTNSFGHNVNLEFNWKVINIETAFPHGNLKETIFMEIPKGMDSSKTECLILKQTIYGLVQSAREFYN
jgi:hypothetical protein